ncbi:hypothetical protein E2C01_001708 [Portunus trituberculatus]|uniref:Uncharacterized protein n=1 Tax=Portunus trituberculatus TaxID=210409 RepID=A0A5B7CIL7_PORTR|nr:hypothetical protein [Portunus trituberculatus]
MVVTPPLTLADRAEVTIQSRYSGSNVGTANLIDGDKERRWHTYFGEVECGVVAEGGAGGGGVVVVGPVKMCASVVSPGGMAAAPRTPAGTPHHAHTHAHTKLTVRHGLYILVRRVASRVFA